MWTFSSLSGLVWKNLTGPHHPHWTSLDKMCVVFTCPHIFSQLVYMFYSSAWVNGLSLPWALGFQPGNLFPVVFPLLQCWSAPLQDALSLNSITHPGPEVSSPTETSTYIDTNSTTDQISSEAVRPPPAVLHISSLFVQWHHCAPSQFLYVRLWEFWEIDISAPSQHHMLLCVQKHKIWLFVSLLTGRLLELKCQFQKRQN